MRKLRAAATAILLGTAALGAGAAFQAAQAATVSAAVGKPLTDARSLADAKKYKEAMDRANAAGAAAKTPAEHQMVDQMKQYIAVKSGDASIGGALGAKAKFANDVNAGRWKDVIADGELLRKNNALDGQSQLVIAQAYYQLHDPKGCIGYIKRAGLGGEIALTLLQRCAYDANDDETQRQALEQLVGSTGKAEHWKSLLHLSERARGLKDHNTLDVYRLKAMTGNLATGDDVMTYAQLALQMKMATEAKNAVQKGIDDKTLPANDRTNRLLKLATDRANEEAANAGNALAAAQKAPKGDDLVQIGEAQIGQGKAKDAIATIQAGIAKGCADTANCQLRLGTAYLAAGQKADAIKAFNAVKGDDKVVMVAHLYALAARSNASTAPADAAPAKGRKR
jgi:hypothetical protein